MWKSASAIGSVWSRLTAVSLLNVSSMEPKVSLDVSSVASSVSPLSASASRSNGISAVGSSGGRIPESSSMTMIESSSRDGAGSVFVATISSSTAASSASRGCHGWASSTASPPRRARQNSRPPTMTSPPSSAGQKLFTRSSARSTIPGSLTRGVRTTVVVASGAASAPGAVVSSPGSSPSPTIAASGGSTASASSAGSSTNGSSPVCAAGGS